MIFEPKGTRLIAASLKNCFPKGIPTMVMHHKTPTIIQLNALNKPPKITHKILPIHPISVTPFRC